jgi:hypothetical protein
MGRLLKDHAPAMRRCQRLRDRPSPRQPRPYRQIVEGAITLPSNATVMGGTRKGAAHPGACASARPKSASAWRGLVERVALFA